MDSETSDHDAALRRKAKALVDIFRAEMKRGPWPSLDDLIPLASVVLRFRSAEVMDRTKAEARKARDAAGTLLRRLPGLLRLADFHGLLRPVLHGDGPTPDQRTLLRLIAALEEARPVLERLADRREHAGGRRIRVAALAELVERVLRGCGREKVSRDGKSLLARIVAKLMTRIERREKEGEVPPTTVASGLRSRPRPDHIAAALADAVLGSAAATKSKKSYP
ncbi:MAG: hypothetical protein QJR07_20025 [Acetobacteraceae bacterium]|nr:hypothetical protein [Acetobacteraceae bacterium]